MITKTGSGGHASEAIFNTAGIEAGFYQVGVRLEATGLPANTGLALNVSTPSPYPPVTVAASSGQPNAANASGPLFLEPGASLAFTVTPFGPMGGATPGWTAKFFLYRADDVSA